MNRKTVEMNKMNGKRLDMKAVAVLSMFKAAAFFPAYLPKLWRIT